MPRAVSHRILWSPGSNLSPGASKEANSFARSTSPHAPLRASRSHGLAESDWPRAIGRERSSWASRQASNGRDGAVPPVSVDRRHPDPADAMRRVTARPRDPAGRSLLESRPDPTRPHSRVTPHVTASDTGRRASGSGGRGCALACIDVSCVRAHVCMAYVFGPADASSGGAKPGPRELVVGKWGLLILRDICATQLKPHVMGLWDAGTTPAAARMGMAWATYGAPMGTADRTARQRRARPPAQRPAPRPERRAPPRWRRPIVRPPLLALLIALFFAFLDFVALYLVISAICISRPDIS